MTLRFSPILLAVSASSAMILSGCSNGPTPAGIGTYNVISDAGVSPAPADYRIGPLDVLKITVFQEPDLSADEVPVDASGNILLPLIGQVTAAGRTGSQLSADIADRLGSRFLVDPQVSIIIVKSVAQRVTVEGSVEKPGVYQIEGSTSLLQAMALASGPSRVAKTSEIIVFRTIDGKVYAAQFNLDLIRRGTQPNPQILGGDIVVVGRSALKGLYKDLLEIAPLLTTTFIQI
jgi:polysaccharide export outer membrane protein